MEFGRERTILLLLIVLALLVGLWFYGYYRWGVPRALYNAPALSGESGADSYVSRISVTFTKEVVPGSTHKSDPRLRTYVGKAQNNGDRTVTFLGIKVVYLDSDKKPIYEKDTALYVTMRPNYIEEFSFGGKGVPAEWSGGVTYQVVKMRFAEDAPIESVSPYYYERQGLDRSLPQIIFSL